MRLITQQISVMLVAGLFPALGQNERPAPDKSHAESHAGNSYVLILDRQAILRGPDFSQRASALLYGKQKHLRDFVWFSIEAGCFVAADPESVRDLKEFERAQQELNKQWARGARDPDSVRGLQQRQNQHTMRRDEFVWALFEKLKNEGRLVNAK